jgi:RecA-family ATPase
VPIGEVTLLVGPPKKGKTSIAIDWSALLSQGTLPGCCAGTPSATILASAEDAFDYTLSPRLMAAGADLTRVVFADMTQGESVLGLTIPNDLDALGELVRLHSAKLVIIDPFIAHLPAEINSHRDQDVRRAMAPLSRFAKEHDVAVLLIAHFNKQQTSDSLSRVGRCPSPRCRRA